MDDFDAWEDEFICPGCDGKITPRYAHLGVCKDCHGTTDDPSFGMTS